MLGFALGLGLGTGINWEWGCGGCGPVPDAASIGVGDCDLAGDATKCPGCKGESNAATGLVGPPKVRDTVTVRIRSRITVTVGVRVLVRNWWQLYMNRW